MKKIFLFVIFSYWIFFFLLPPFQTPDEQGHFEVIYWISKGIIPLIPTKDIPGPRPGFIQQEPFKDIVQHKNVTVNYKRVQLDTLLKLTNYPRNIEKQFRPFAPQIYNPPVYYLVGALFLLIAKLIHANLLNQISIVRLASSLFYFATIYTAFKLLAEVFRKKNIVNGMFLLFALNPLLIQSGIGISPDIAVTFFCTLFLYLVTKYKKSILQPRKIVLVSIVVGLACLSKITGIILIPSFVLYLYFECKNRNAWIKPSFLFLFLTLIIQLPWFALNYARYHSPINVTPALGEQLTNGLFVSPITAITSSLWGYRHVFMHYSGFLGWNEAYPPAPIFISYAIIFIITVAVGIVVTWKKKGNFYRLISFCAGFLFLFFLCLDVVRKLHSHQGWEIGGRNALLIFLPLLIFSLFGISKILHVKIERISHFLFYFSIVYYYYIITFVLIPRYY